MVFLLLQFFTFMGCFQCKGHEYPWLTYIRPNRQRKFLWICEPRDYGGTCSEATSTSKTRVSRLPSAILSTRETSPPQPMALRTMSFLSFLNQVVFFIIFLYFSVLAFLKRPFGDGVFWPFRANPRLASKANKPRRHAGWSHAVAGPPTDSACVREQMPQNSVAS